MNKEEIIRRYGNAEYERRLQQSKEWKAKHWEEEKIRKGEWREANLEREQANHREWYKNNLKRAQKTGQERHRKGGKYYEKTLKDERTGLRGNRNCIRKKHAKYYRPFKQIIAPDSQVHHEWIPNTAGYRGVALVEKDSHQHGYVDVIQILQGEITLLEEKRGVGG